MWRRQLEVTTPDAHVSHVTGRWLDTCIFAVARF